jgi:hypothetical protein
MRSIIAATIIRFLRNRDEQNPFGFWSLDSGTWAYRVLRTLR